MTSVTFQEEQWRLVRAGCVCALMSQVLGMDSLGGSASQLLCPAAVAVLHIKHGLRHLLWLWQNKMAEA